jgi:DNA polymerase-3 subunit delta'
MVWPEKGVAIEWLATKGIPNDLAHLLLSAAGGRPEDALAYSASGRNPQDWAALPKAMAHGDVNFVREWTAAQLIDGLHKLCHDMLARQTGAVPRFFEVTQLGPQVPLSELTQWSKSLSNTMKTMDHPFNAGLMQEALVGQAQRALNSKH